MRLNEEVFTYLENKKFSNGLKVDIHGENYNLDRVQLIKKIFSRMRVIHVGCADHVPLIEQKMASSSWLHGEMEKVVSNLIGLDINEDAIAFIKDKGVKNVFYTDIVKDDVLQEIKTNKWDYLFLGEIVEHLDDPVLFLKTIRSKYKKHVESIVVTVPNAFRFANFKYALSNKELINSDHRYWFTPYTIAKILTQAGMQVDDYFLIDAFSSSSFFKSFRRKFFPVLSDTIVMVAKL
jgi:2-polyprenyl-3-methyl-5-hydroxy-6-metoxy-1,4-benzoquinol methylase